MSSVTYNAAPLVAGRMHIETAKPTRRSNAFVQCCLRYRKTARAQHARGFNCKHGVIRLIRAQKMRLILFALVGKTLHNILVRNRRHRFGNGCCSRCGCGRGIGRWCGVVCGRGCFFLVRYRQLRNPEALHLLKRGHDKRGMMRTARILKYLIDTGIFIIPCNNMSAIFDNACFLVSNFFARRT